MSEPALRHQMVCSENRINIILVDSNSNSHQHVLWPLYYFSRNFQEIRSLKSLKTKIIIIKVPVINYLTVQASSILKYIQLEKITQGSCMRSH